MENEIDILVVEDEALIANNIKMLLQEFGYNVTAVCYKYITAKIAIEQLDFDLLITDINLGDGIDKKSGIELAQIVKNTKKCPIIFLTAFSDKDTISKATSLSPSAYLVKPINGANLFAAVQLAVNNFITPKSSTVLQQAVPDYFFIKNGNTLIKLHWANIYHLESVKNYVKIKSTDHITPLLHRGSLQNFMEKMMPKPIKNIFIKINRSEALLKGCILKVRPGIVETTFGDFNTSSDFKLEE